MTATLNRPATAGVPAAPKRKRSYRVLILTGVAIVGLLVGALLGNVAGRAAGKAPCIEALDLADKGFSATSAAEYLRTIEPRYNYTKAVEACRG
jgi:hypothetical protein